MSATRSDQGGEFSVCTPPPPLPICLECQYVSSTADRTRAKKKMGGKVSDRCSHAYTQRVFVLLLRAQRGSKNECALVTSLFFTPRRRPPSPPPSPFPPSPPCRFTSALLRAILFFDAPAQNEAFASDKHIGASNDRKGCSSPVWLAVYSSPVRSFGYKKTGLCLVSAFLCSGVRLYPPHPLFRPFTTPPPMPEPPRIWLHCLTV